MSADFIVYATTNAAKDGFNSEGEWTVTFPDKSLSGHLTQLGGNAYKLKTREKTHYFHADQVIRVTPLDEI